MFDRNGVVDVHVSNIGGSFELHEFWLKRRQNVFVLFIA